MPKKFIIIPCVIGLLAFLVYYLWGNALSLDDFHHESAEFNPSYLEEEKDLQNDSSGGSENRVKKGWHIHVNLDEHKMYVYKDSELIKTYPCSGGKPSTPSPLGTWKIISKDTWGEGFGGAWLGFNVPWGMYGFHGTVEPWFVGRSNSSKGCIRMKNADVRELFKMVPHGTTVTIVYDNKPFHPMKSGDVGSDIRDVQKALVKMRYYHGGANGRFGTGLKAAVMKFQKDNGLYVNGVINKKTYDLIINKSAEYE